jgi:hypothetical protein
VFFEVYSAVPGEVILTAEADGLVTIGEVKAKFLPLPFPANVTVNLELPKFLAPIFGGNDKGEVTVLQPDSQQFNNDNSVNMGMKINVPSWVVLTIFFSLVANLFFLILLIYLTYRIRWVQAKEVKEIEKDTALLEKEEKEIETLVEEEKSKKLG